MAAKRKSPGPLTIAAKPVPDGFHSIAGYQVFWVNAEGRSVKIALPNIHRSVYDARKTERDATC